MLKPSVRRRPTLQRAGLALAAASAVLLAACGGGGGGADAGDPLQQPYNLDTAITKALATTTTVSNLTATNAGTTYTLSMTFTPVADAVFEGALAKTSLQSVTVSGGPGASETDATTLYYRTGPYFETGQIDSDGAYTLFTRTGDLPSSARPGDSGNLNTGVTYTDNTKATVFANSTTTWSVVADTTTTAFACMNTTVTEVSPPDTSTQSICLKINANGDVVGGRVTVTALGVTLEFK